MQDDKGTLDNRWVDADTAEKLGIAANEDPNATFPPKLHGPRKWKYNDLCLY